LRSRFCASINVHGGLSEAGASFFAHTPVLLPPVTNGPGSGGLSAFTALLITLQVVIGGLGLSRSAVAGPVGGGRSGFFAHTPVLLTVVATSVGPVLSAFTALLSTL
jgi:hypothetical protein